MTDLTFSRSAQIALPGGITSFNPFAMLARLVHGIRVYRDRNATRRELLLLTDRELNDIGLRRSDIETVACAIR